MRLEDVLYVEQNIKENDIKIYLYKIHINLMKTFCEILKILFDEIYNREMLMNQNSYFNK